MITDETLRSYITHNELVGELGTPAITSGDLATIATELLSRREADEWQPIETAPKDRLVLLACADWAHTTYLGKPAPVKVGGRNNGRWEVFGASWTPTHWRKLPSYAQGQSHAGK